MKTIVISERSKDKLLHIEAPGCIVNIRVGLSDSNGNAITSVEVKCDEYAGEPHVYLPDFDNAKALNVRVLKEVTQPETWKPFLAVLWRNALRGSRMIYRKRRT
jgi:hypothetical protein